MRHVIKKVSVFLAVAVLLSPTVSSFSPQIATALEGDPMMITTCDDLYEVVEDLSGRYQLAGDIDCATTADDNPNTNEWVDGIVGGTLIPDSLAGVANNGYYGFLPIGTFENPFRGEFDGNGHTISNLWIFRKDDANIGLFGRTESAAIRNLTLTNSSVVGGYSTGGVVGSASNTRIEEVTVQNGMTRSYLSFHGGGIAGETYYDELVDAPSVISGASVVGGTVHGSGNLIGGLVGYMNGGVISDSYTSADIDGGYSIGGAVGYMSNGTIIATTVDEVLVRGEFLEGVIAKSGDKIGGFVGDMDGGAIYDSSTGASVESEGSEIGGFVGRIDSFSAEYPSTIDGSFATGSVVGLGNVNDNAAQPAGNSNNVGGFAGVVQGEGVAISNSYATGSVTVNDNPSFDNPYGAGGFVGQAGCAAQISYSHATGLVSAPRATGVGGFGGADGCEGPGSTYLRVFANGAVQGLEDVGGLIGRATNATIGESYATGSVNGNVNIGGLVGFYSGSTTVSESYATGAFEALDRSAGGAFGYFSGTAEDVYARGAVTGPASVGGFAGETQGSWTIRNAYATGALSATPGPAYGFIGEDTTPGEVTATGLFYDQQTTGVSTDTYATALNTNQMRLAVNQPTFTGYDFDTVWEFSLGLNDNYPIFQWQNDPLAQILCEPASMTATTGRIACEVVYSGGDPSRADQEVWMNPQYRKVGETTWNSLDWVASDEGRYIYYNLDPDTSYEFSYYVMNNIIDRELIVVGTTLPLNADADGDGIRDTVEHAGPNRGDANNDGMLDAEQQQVSSILNEVTNTYAVLQTDCSVNTALTLDAESDTLKDPGYQYSAGLMSFTSTGCSQSATITQYFFGNFPAAQHVARKLNPNTGAYSTIPGAALTNVVVDGQPALRVVYTVLDNGPLDLDPTPGTITDPSGPGSLAAGAPNTGLRR